jgi:hypothetical protein
MEDRNISKVWTEKKSKVWTDNALLNAFSEAEKREIFCRYRVIEYKDRIDGTGFIFM